MSNLYQSGESEVYFWNGSKMIQCYAAVYIKSDGEKAAKYAIKPLDKKSSYTNTKQK